MKIRLIKPYGMCKGVKRSFDIALRAKQENVNKNVKVLGLLIHNKRVLDELEKEQIETVYDIDEARKNDIIVLRAHGTKTETYNILKNNNIEYYDSTCPFVKSINDYIIKNQNKEIIYLGIKNHDESNVSISFSKNIHFFDIDEKDNFDFSKIKTNNPIIINQSTLNAFEIFSSVEYIRKKIPLLINKTRICPSLNDRFKKLKKIYNKNDFFIIIGSDLSNNAKELFKLTNPLFRNSILTNKVTDIKKTDLEKFKSVYIISATSTLNFEVENFINHLKSL